MSLEFELTSSEKITMLLDGELSQTEVGNVFFNVAQDEKLQQDFISELQIRKLMKPAAVIPPDNLRLGIISTLGIGTIGFWGNFAETSKLIASSKVFLMLLATITGAAGTYLFMNNAQNELAKTNSAQANLRSSNSSGNNFNDNQANNQSVNNFGANNFNANNASTNNANGNRNKFRKNNLPPVSKSTEIEQTQELISANSNPIVIAENSGNAKENSQIQVEPIAQTINTNAMQNSNLPISVPIQTMNKNEIVPNLNLMKSRYTNNDSRFMATFRGFATQNSGNINLAPESSPSINNIAIGTMFEFTKNFSAGFEFGQENFVQQFKVTSANNEIDLIQNKLAFWGGVNLSYKLDKIQSLENLQPYGTLFIGGTNFGYITRQSLGLNYEINSQFAMFTGLEYTSLFSSYNAIWSSSQKYGMTYGIQLKF